ncbi:hypothetical protein [Virgibacillus siamensis]|uniref:hypothetical protein n=1 Tax=Virgibacillus siamensis TaxID=480071 RepID=UPI0009845672|nr:hypothetical protein [Virgibacillus siamensis]
MTWIYAVIIIAVIIILVMFLKSKGQNPNKNAALSKEEKEELHEDYLSHGETEDHNSQRNL